MNVYLDRLAGTMAERGIDVTTFTRKSDPAQPEVVDVDDRYRVVHVEAGPTEPISLSEMRGFTPMFTKGVIDWIDRNGATYDLVHSHYWLSGRTGLRVKERYGIPLANSFHTLGRVKDLTLAAGERPSSSDRLLTEEEVIARSDCVIASTPYEFEDLLEHYGASPERLCVSPPGVDHALFTPGDRRLARQRLGLDGGPIVLYAGRIQPHKGTAIAVESFVRLCEILDPALGEPILQIVGGASGSDGDAERARCEAVAAASVVNDNVFFRDPVPHAVLADYYRAANVVIVPSRSESFGLVAAEAQACGTPVVASNTGGLAHVIAPSDSGLLVDGADPKAFATAMGAIIAHPGFAERLSQGAVAFSQKFSWEATTDRMLELYEGITAAENDL
jgi:D-inositol-3-phosphate glycosyltransferase